MSDRPHIVILMPDQHRGDCLSCAGHPVVRTPNLDRIAAEGIRFTNAYTTSPLCMPARNSFLAGLFCHNHGQWDNVGHLPPDADTYLRHVKARGYRTCQVGKSHLYEHVRGEHLNRYRPFMHALGWDDVLETTGPHATRWTDSIVTDHWQSLGCLKTFRDDYTRRVQAGSLAATWPSPMPDGQTLDDFVGRTAVEYVRGYHRDEPLLLFVGFPGPHEPWDPPADWAARYDPTAMDPVQPVPEPPSWLPLTAAEYHRRTLNRSLAITPEISGRIRALYYAKISHIDAWVGRILDALAERGMLDDTAVMVWSDHGEMLCDKGRLHKQVCFESSARVPFLLRPPRCANPGAVSDRLISLVDGFPTILELAGCEPPAECFGRSLLPLIGRPDAQHHDAVFSEVGDRTMIRDERHKMVVNAAGDVLSLYDMIDDPAERLNLVGRDDMAETVARLRDRLLDWLLSTQQRQVKHPPAVAT